MTQTAPLVPLILLILALPLAADPEEKVAVPAAVVKRLASATRETAREGREAETGRLLSILDRVGCPRRDLSGLKREAAESLARGGGSGRALPALVRKVSFLARELERLLPGLDGETQSVVARVVLELDSERSAARAVLGQVREEGVWGRPGASGSRRRRRLVLAAVQDTLRLELPLEEGESHFGFLERVLGRSAAMVRWESFTFHGNMGVARLALIARDALRGAALSRRLRLGGGLRVPAFLFERDCQTFVVLDSKELYLRAVEECRKDSLFSAEEAEEAQHLSAQFSSTGFCLNWDGSEAGMKASLFSYVGDFRDTEGCGRHANAALYAGHMNWICLALFGASLPGTTWEGMAKEACEDLGPDYADGEPTEARRDLMTRLRLAQSSLPGCRSWLIDLVERGHDPSWETCLSHKEIGRVSGTCLLKATLVAEHLQERGMLGWTLAGTCLPMDDRERDGSVRSTALFEKAVGEAVTRFEERWRDWLLVGRPGLCQILAGDREGLSKAEEAVLAHLDRYRQAAWDNKSLGGWVPLGIDRELSRAAAAHAAYLALNPDQSAEWPGVHEEFSDREGYSPEGCWAGLHSVIWPGDFSRKPEEAVDKWMATFYHRLPLLDPRLARVGWGSNRSFAVLDAGSLVLPDDRTFAVVWPFPGMRDVPRRFVPEMPDPLPTEAERERGYPITMQRRAREALASLTMRLYEGREAHAGREVDCFFSSPARPTNHAISCSDAWCLIPRKILKRHTLYLTVVEGGADDDNLRWTFTTGS
jgi:hypothetical protein